MKAMKVVKFVLKTNKLNKLVRIPG